MKAKDYMKNEKAVSLMGDADVLALYEARKGVLFESGYLGLKDGIEDLMLDANNLAMSKRFFSKMLGSGVIILSFLYLLLEEFEENGFEDVSGVYESFYNMAHMKAAKREAEELRSQKKDYGLYPWDPDVKARELGFGLKKVPPQEKFYEGSIGSSQSSESSSFAYA